MSITIQCPNCGKRYTVDESAAGKVATCAACGVKMRIPAVAAAPPPPEPAPEPAPAPDAPQPAPPEPSAAGLPTEMRANRALEGRICPACGDPIQLGQPVRNCELCGRTHHADCWRKHNGCATLGCDNAPLPELGFAPEHQAAAAPGAPAPPTGETRKCPDCGEDVAKGAAKCPYCGKLLRKRAGRARFTRRSDTARNALICGILSIFCCGIILGPIAIIQALKAKKEIAASRGALTGGGMATAGLVCGIVGMVGAVLILLARITSAGSH